MASMLDCFFCLFLQEAVHGASVQISNLYLRLDLNAIGLGFRLGDSDDLVWLEYPTNRV